VRVLAGDIGGTHCRIALLEAAGDGIASIREEVFPSTAFPGLEPILERFLSLPDPAVAGSSSPGASAERACFGVPGAVHEGITRTTNLPWIVDAGRLAAVLGLRPEQVRLINDLEAWAWGIDVLAPEDFLVLQEGRPDPARPSALIAAGTGLGEAALIRGLSGSVAIASEGGHGDFAPNDLIQWELWRHLLKRFGHVSWERVLSGPGLVQVYEFLRGQGTEAEPAWLSEGLRVQDPAAVITAAALEGKDPVCAQALDVFVSVYGAEAGNMALRFLAFGGVFLGGGIAPRILPRLQDRGFLEAFRSKGRMRPLLEEVPVKVALNERTALLGAARRAAAGLPTESRR
jgi:glucokinase